MRGADGFVSVNQSLTTSATTAAPGAMPGVEAQGLVVTLVGVAGVLFMFAAFNALNRAEPVRVSKQ